MMTPRLANIQNLVPVRTKKGHGKENEFRNKWASRFFTRTTNNSLNKNTFVAVSLHKR